MNCAPPPRRASFGWPAWPPGTVHTARPSHTVTTMTLSPDATRTRRATAAIATVDLRVAAAIAGDAAALESLVRDYRPRIFRYARARLRDDATADDVTQEVCMALIRALPTHRFRRYSVTAFIFGITANKVAMSHRAHYRRRRREQPVGLAPECADDALDPAQRAEQAETRAYVTALLEHLPPASRHLLTLRLAVGLSAKETGKVLGMSAGAVRVAQHRALQTLHTLAADRPR